MQKGIALFVTEWGTGNFVGRGGPDENETKTWMAFLQTNHISHVNWVVNDKAEGHSALVPGASSLGGWSAEQLTPSGKLAADIIRHWPAPPPPLAASPVTVSSSYSRMLPLGGVVMGVVSLAGGVFWLRLRRKRKKLFG